MGVKEDIKTLFVQSSWTMKAVAEEMTKRSGRVYSSQMLSQKLYRENLHYKEAKLIGEILGYELKFEKTNSKISN
ncbi:LLM class flavin-dependent oxidoreductase [bacterium]|nr:LLM class flavin-dependent oxidoreductase [bacterium]